MNGLAILSGQSGEALARKVCHLMGQPLTPATVNRFADGEVHVEIEESVRNKDVFIINSLTAPAENFLEMVLLAEAARGSSAGRITLVPTYLGYNRQDRKDKPRVPISARVMARFLSHCGAHRALLFDLHSEATMGFFEPNVIIDHLYASFISVPYLQKIVQGNFVVAAPDKGGAPRASHYAHHLRQNNYVMFSKERKRMNEVDAGSIKIIGDIRDKDVILIDDMIDTGGTIMADASAAKKAGAKDIHVFATHGLFSRNALEKFDQSDIKEIIITDSVNHPESALKTEKIKLTVLSMAPLLAQAISFIHEEQSLASLILRK